MARGNLAVALLLLLGALAVASPAQASASPAQASAHNFSPSPPSGSAPRAPQETETAPQGTPDNCGSAKKILKERVARGDPRGVICHQTRGTPKSAESAAKKAASRIKASIPFPVECLTDTAGAWRFVHRRLACRYMLNETRSLFHFDPTTGILAEVGKIWYIQADLVLINPNTVTYQYQQSISPFKLERSEATGMTISGGFSCVGWCEYGPVTTRSKTSPPTL